MVNWPECIAVRTERRESQFRDGARSNRTVGSLHNQKEFLESVVRTTYESSVNNRVRKGNGRIVDMAGGFGDEKCTWRRWARKLRYS